MIILLVSDVFCPDLVLGFCPSGIPALVLPHHLPISQSIWWEHGTEGSLHALLQ